MTYETCYGKRRTLVLRALAWLSDMVLPYMSMRLFSRLNQLSLQFNFQLLRLISWANSRPLPPNYNSDFRGDLRGVEPAQVKWFTECPGRQPSDPVILYLHGGGYGMTIVVQQLDALLGLYLGVANRRLSILVLDYTTTVYAEYPTQLREAAEVYGRLAESCENIVLLGDSAGGHLSLQLMRHIVEPAEDAVPRVTQKPAAFVGISPAINMYVPPDMRGHRNSRHDVVSVHMMRGWSEMLSSSEEVRAGPKIRLSVDKSIDWDRALPPPARVFISFGGREVLVDSIKDFVESNRLAEKGATISHHPLDVHDSLMLIGSESPVEKPAIEFLRTVLS